MRLKYAQITAQYHEPELQPAEFGFKVTFVVNEWLKGSPEKKITLLTGRSGITGIGGDCGAGFQLSKTYVV